MTEMIPPIVDSTLLPCLLQRHRVSRAGYVERHVPFLWSKFFIAAFSYALLLSDVLRAGLGIKSITLPRLEPNQVMSFGPYAYPVTHIQHNQTDGTESAWAYKFDTTSVAMRAYAEFFQLQTWPPCLFYRKPCPSATLESSTIFHMLDSLADAMAGTRTASRSKALTLRTTNLYVDRLHDLILPQIFRHRMTRTNQALHYDSDTLRAPGFHLCSRNPIRPYACLDFWTHYTPICRTTNSACSEVGHVWRHILDQTEVLRQRYSNMTVDVMILESLDDSSKPALSFYGRKYFDIVVITRVRNCTEESHESRAASACSTIAIDDYRYEGASFTSDVTSWYRFVAALRCVGQTYVWVRLAMLYFGCFLAISAEPRFVHASLHVRLVVGMRTMFLVPCQVVIYGSIFPIACYVFAHVLDSAMVYEFVSFLFDSALGELELDLQQFLLVSAVLMRSMWELALLLHALLAFKTWRNWSPAEGVPGIREFSVSFVSCLSIMAQFRAIAFRDARVDSISEVVQSSRMAAIRSFTYDNSRGPWRLVLLGNTLDVQCWIGSVSVFAILMLLAGWVLRLLSTMKLIKRMNLFVWKRTLVSYAAGTLWPTNALVVSWEGLLAPHKAKRWHINEAAVQKRTKKPSDELEVSPVYLFHETAPSRYDFALLDQRGRKLESMVTLMNLAAMTDPIAFARLRWFGGKTIAIYESKATKRLFFIPVAQMGSPLDVPVSSEEYNLLLLVSTSDLPWQDLLHCG